MRAEYRNLVIVGRISRTSYRKKGIVNLPVPPWPLDGPVRMEGVLPDCRVQSKSRMLSDLDCSHPQKSSSKSHDGSEKRYTLLTEIKQIKMTILQVRVFLGTTVVQLIASIQKVPTASAEAIFQD